MKRESGKHKLGNKQTHAENNMVAGIRRATIIKSMNVLID
jgi:hypothetical protein